MDWTRAVFGEHARHVPAWLYVQDQGSGVVSIAGASSVAGAHPLRYGSERAHQFVLGEIIIRPHLVVATDALTGSGINGLLTGDHDTERMLSAGEILLDRMPPRV
jgi:hypothetical protein